MLQEQLAEQKTSVADLQEKLEVSEKQLAEREEQEKQHANELEVGENPNLFSHNKMSIATPAHQMFHLQSCAGYSYRPSCPTNCLSVNNSEGKIHLNKFLGTISAGLLTPFHRGAGRSSCKFFKMFV